MRMQDHAAVSLSIRARCRTLGIFTLRAGLAGNILERDEDGPMAAWGKTDAFQHMIKDAASQWAQEPAPRVLEPVPALFLLPVAEGSGRSRQGFTVAVLAGPAWLQSESGAAAIQASTDAGAALAAVCTHDRASAELFRTSLRWMSEDVARVVDQGEAVRDLTSQLTDSYETLDALYSIGRSMQGLAEPSAFIHTSVQRLHASLRFETVFIQLGGDAAWNPCLRGKVFSAGRRPGTMHDIEQGTAESLLGTQGGAGFRIVTADRRLTDDDHREALLLPLMRKQTPIGVMVGMHKTGADPAISSYDIQLMESTAGFLGAFLDNVAVYEEQRQMFLGTVHALTAAIDAKDRYTRGHSERVAHLSARLAEATGMNAEQVHRVWIAGLVHDVGKIGVPEAVLSKQGRLTDEEFAQIKRHPEIGHHILKDIRPLSDVLPGVLYHHEKYDGRGYPTKLVGQQIPLLARIIALADTFDAMSSTRSYRPAMPREKVLEEIRRCAGSQFDPGLACKFVELDFSEFDAMVERSRAAEAWSAAA